MGKTTGCDQILAKLVKEGGKELKKVLLNSFSKYGRKSSYHRSGNVAKCVQFIRRET